jgi:hypothetical protein
MEAVAPRIQTVCFRPDFLYRFQQGKSAHNVGLDKESGPQDGAVYMAFGGKMHHGINFVLLE